jgi:hypothetical protein
VTKCTGKRLAKKFSRTDMVEVIHGEGRYADSVIHRHEEDNM